MRLARWLFELLAWSALGWCCAAEKRSVDGHVFDTPFGQTYCAERRIGECGVTLSDCADGHVYRCMFNVREREASR